MNELLNKLGICYVLHGVLGGFICALMTLVALLQETGGEMEVWRCALTPLIGIVCVFILSWIKEYIMDEKPDWKDILWAMGGCGVTWLASLLGLLFRVLG